METESEPVNENEARRRTGVERVYENGEIAVLWEPKLCIHAGNCFRGLPEVFQPESRPWVKVDAASADRIAEVVMTCPTGALHFERLNGGPQEPQPQETTINARPNGPLYVRGKIRITGPGVISSGKIHGLRYAGVVTRRTNLFAMAAIVEQGSVHRHGPKVQIEPGREQSKSSRHVWVWGMFLPRKGGINGRKMLRISVKCNH